MATSWFGIALFTRTAAVVESTPPETATIALPLPICFLISLTLLSMNFLVSNGMIHNSHFILFSFLDETFAE
ncbi:Uncharacterised protein [Candidatus Gugararchaeum adminiculabundum]|nr:Uncharacterised protein [Candidatus Gugararchaeum adminiculabundum]